MNISFRIYNFYSGSVTAVFVLLLSIISAEASMDEALFAARNRDFEQAFQLFLVEAKSGNPEAKYRVGNMLSAGTGIKKDEKLALDWFQQAADLGHTKATKKLTRLRSAVQSINNPEAKLLKASRVGDVEVIENLIEIGTDLNAQDKLGSTPLMEAVRENQNAAVSYLLSRGANTNTRNKLGDAALLIAVTLNNFENVQSILNHNSNVDVQDKHKSSPLILATSRENLKTVRLLIEHNADIFLRNDEGRSAYDIALSSKNKLLIEMIKKAGGKKLADLIRMEDEKQKGRLLSANADIPSGWSPLMYGAWRGDIVAVKTSLASNTDIEQQNNLGVTALSLAASGGHTEIVEMLLAKGANLKCDANDVNPVLLAIKSGHRLMVDTLISPLVEKDECKEFLATMLNYSLASERFSIAEKFIKRGININHDKFKSPLITMSSGISEDIVRALIKNGADVNAQDEYGQTALMIASREGNSEALKTLIDLGAEVNLKDEMGRTSLNHSVAKEQLLIVKYLIEKGADALSLTTENNSALMLAARSGNVSIVNILAPFGNLDQKNNVGDTALIMAARGGYLDVSDALLKKGANPRINNNRKENALNVVHTDNNQLYALIEEYSSSRSWINDIF